MKVAPTASQTVGPFFAFALPYEGGGRLVSEKDPDALRISGTLRDGEGAPVPDGLIEIWQANRRGRYAHPEDTRDDVPLEEGFTGFGRCETDADGRFEFLTLKPGPVPAVGGGMQAPHINVAVFARGLVKHLFTRIYFPDEPAANAADPLLSEIEDSERRTLLVAQASDDGLVFDIHLQGAEETPFFDA